jgi:hypothetical protein
MPGKSEARAAWAALAVSIISAGFSGAALFVSMQQTDIARVQVNDNRAEALLNKRMELCATALVDANSFEQVAAAYGQGNLGSLNPSKERAGAIYADMETPLAQLRLFGPARVGEAADVVQMRGWLAMNLFDQPAGQLNPERAGLIGDFSAARADLEQACQQSMGVFGDHTARFAPPARH